MTVEVPKGLADILGDQCPSCLYTRGAHREDCAEVPTSRVVVTARGARVLACRCGTRTRWRPDRQRVSCTGCGSSWHST